MNGRNYQSERERGMPKKRTIDVALVDSITDSLVEALQVFPKKLLGTSMLQRNHQMPMSQIQILMMLNESDLSVGQLSRRLDIAKPNVTPLIDSMCDAGLVERIRDEQDRRVVNVHLLPAGQTRMEQVRGSLYEWVMGWAEKLNRSETKELKNALACLLRIFGGEMESK